MTHDTSVVIQFRFNLHSVNLVRGYGSTLLSKIKWELTIFRTIATPLLPCDYLRFTFKNSGV